MTFRTFFCLIFIFLFAFTSICQAERKLLTDSLFVKGDVIRFPDMVYGCKPMLRPENYDSIRPVAEFLSKHPNLLIEIAVHTDSRGNEKDNSKLSQNRADDIRNALVNDFKINPNRITAKGYGESQPLVPLSIIQKAKTKEEQEALHQKNRRTELIVTKVE